MRLNIDKGNYLEGLHVYGLSSALKMYTLAWKINQELEISLAMQEDKQIQLKGQEIRIRYYLYETENTCVRLLKNRNQIDTSSQFIYLVPELNSFDYLLTIQISKDQVINLKEFSSMQQIDGINMAVNVQNDKLKHLENLIF